MNEYDPLNGGWASGLFTITPLGWEHLLHIGEIGSKFISQEADTARNKFSGMNLPRLPAMPTQAARREFRRTFR